MFWIHVTLSVLALAGMLFIILGADGNTSLWTVVPGIAILIMMTISLPYSYKRWREYQPKENA
jgi:hypothetical protein